MIIFKFNRPFVSFLQYVYCISIAFVYISFTGCITNSKLPPKTIVTNKENGAVLDPIIVSSTNPLSIYRSTFALPFETIHTDLQIAFDMKAHYVLGTEKLTIRPFAFRQINNIVLDAKSMQINSVWINGESQQFTYTSNKLTIQLPKQLQYPNQQIVEINYTAMPDSITGGSAAIRAAKGLYFINTDKKDRYKPTQIWTQGETESNSGWFPTVDKPNNKSSFDVHIKVPKNFTTMSNGLLIKTEKNNDYKIDHWQQKQAMSVYLCMLAIGEYASQQDVWQGKQVQYLVEPNYQAEARENFSNTPEMIQFFSDKLGVPFAWDKYAQITARDYVSGAMENTSASLFGEFVQKHSAELVDNGNENIVAHELFHQWFGDLVTCESWSNLVLNEGFANYGEYLWLEHKYGIDNADRYANGELQRYLAFAQNDDGPIVRFYFRDREAMFTAITYKKGGRVLHLLRKEIGDDIFFASLKDYLTQFAYQTAEVHDLRKVFEKNSGKDLTQFFNQWFYKPSHPNLKLNYRLINKDTLLVKYLQTSDSNIVFTTPIDFKITSPKASVNKHVIINQPTDSFMVNIAALQLADANNLPAIYADAQHTFIGTITDNKMPVELANTFYLANNSTDKIRALTTLIKNDSNNIAKSAAVYAALIDDNKYVRNAATKFIDIKKWGDRDRLKNICRNMATTDSYAGNREIALDLLAQMQDKDSKQLFVQQLSDSSAAVTAKALLALNAIDSVAAYTKAKQLANNNCAAIKMAVGTCLSQFNNLEDTTYFNTAIPHSFGNERISLLLSFNNYVHKLSDKNAINNAINLFENYALHDERETIKIAAVKQLNTLATDLLDNKLTISAQDSKQIHATILAKVQHIYTTEKNTKAIAEYKRLGWMK